MRHVIRHLEVIESGFTKPTGHPEQGSLVDGLSPATTANGRARCHMYLDMHVFIRGTKLHWEVEKANIKYSDVVVDRVGHVGGETVKILGDAFTKAVKQWFPKKERQAIEKAKSAVTKTLKGSENIRSKIAQVIKQRNSK